MRLTDRVDLDLYYEIDSARFDESVRRVVTREVFKSIYADCPSVGLECDGQPIGGVIFDGESAHIAILPSHHGRWAHLLRPLLAWLFSFKQEIFVHLEAENSKGLAFVERCGWQRVRAEGDEVVYLMTPGGGRRAARVDLNAKSD
ncbi:GNAT family N-acetyltransferase [Trinickia terrae]|nr:GNAT family N-acetyltransferase [Trinickia terrae]